MNTILIFGLIRLFFITGLAACLNCSSSSTRSTYFKKGTLLLQTAKKSSAYLSGNNTAIFSKRTLPTLSYNLSLTHTMLERAFSDDKQAAEWLAYVSSQGLTHHHPHVHMLAKAGLMLLKRVGLAGVKRNDSAAEELGQELFVHLRDYVTTSRPLDKHASWILGFSYYYALGTNRSTEEAVRLYRLAAEQGLAAAQYSLATCLTDGFGTQRDYPQAAWWYYQAAKQGDMVCQNILARCYYVSRGVKRDYGRAVRWYIKAAQQGYVDAYTSIGKCYLYGRGVQSDPVKAEKMFRYAAQRDDPDAMSLLGHLLLQGKYQSQEGVEWVIKAAQKGHVKAQLSLAWFHLLGYGVPQSFYEAYKWMYVILTVDCR